MEVVKDKIFKKEFAGELFAIAQNDLQAAITLNSDPLVRKETALLMIQQCIEKCFKAILCSVEVAIPQTHDLSLLLDRISAAQISIPTYIANTDFDELTPFATLRRYEEGRFEILDSDVQGAVQLATSVVDWTKKELNS
jgi:HEPN domain-containing protein